MAFVSRKAVVSLMTCLDCDVVLSNMRITPQLGFDYLRNFGFTTLVDRKEINGEIFSDIQQSLALGGITNGVTNERQAGAI